jgi:hypothetical protein
MGTAIFLFSGLLAVAIGDPCFFYTKTLPDKTALWAVFFHTKLSTAGKK